MRFITAEECRNWLSENSITIASQAIRERGFSMGQFTLPTDTSRLIAISQNFQNLTGIHEGLLWITQWGIWPENMNLFDAYRSHLGEVRALHEAPGHLFTLGDVTSFASILNLGLFFLWDVIVAGPKFNTVVQFSHDEYFTVISEDVGTWMRIKNSLIEFDLKEVEV